MSEVPASAYDMSHVDEAETRCTLAILVDNEPGVLGRVVGLFSARGYNIESLTVAEVDRDRHRSRITIVTTGTAHTLEQIEAQLLRLVPVASVTDIPNPGAASSVNWRWSKWPGRETGVLKRFA